jgi:2-keto-4-pentenoate hydratase/2-oxohepta-3-ene-1,7-dioic acid hydratase in catechol pathway
MSEHGRILLDGRPTWVRVAAGEAVPLAAPPWREEHPPAGARALDPTAVRWLPPVEPSKIVCFGRNYAAHAAEMGATPPERPILFLKAPSSLLPPGSPVPLPPESARVECEGELALVIGRRVRRFPASGEAGEVVHGWLVADDVTARDLQRAEGQWARGKSFDGFCPLSRLVSSRPPAADARLSTHVNGALAQEARLDAMLFPVAELLAWASAAMTLEPGDLVLTGTPEGVRALAAGDEVRVEVEGLPELVHGVVAERA